MKAFKFLIDAIREKFFSGSSLLEEAEATILEFHSTGVSKNGTLPVQLLLQVTPRQGRNFIALCKRDFNEKELQGYAVGIRIKIYYQRNNPMKIHLMKDNIR